jgi:hypothetical protein
MISRVSSLYVFLLTYGIHGFHERLSVWVFNEFHCEGYHLSLSKLNHICFISGSNLHYKQGCFVVNPRLLVEMQNSPSYLFGAWKDHMLCINIFSSNYYQVIFYFKYLCFMHLTFGTLK